MDEQRARHPEHGSDRLLLRMAKQHLPEYRAPAMPEEPSWMVVWIVVVALCTAVQVAAFAASGSPIAAGLGALGAMVFVALLLEEYLG